MFIALMYLAFISSYQENLFVHVDEGHFIFKINKKIGYNMDTILTSLQQLFGILLNNSPKQPASFYQL